MKISIIGNNLTGLILAKALSNKNINVEIFYSSKSKKLKSNRTIAITNKNMNFVEKNLFHISKKLLIILMKLLLQQKIVTIKKYLILKIKKIFFI